MSVQKAIEYINKVIEVMDNYDIDEYVIDFSVDELIRGHLYNAIHELKTNKELEWGKVEKCDCGKDSVCNVFEKNESKRYFCWECFFKYSEKNN